MCAGMMPILVLVPGLMTPGQFGPMSRVFGFGQEVPHADHVEHRDALGDAMTTRSPPRRPP
jgi:hypothetical protein